MQRYSTFGEMFDLVRDFDRLFRRPVGYGKELPTETMGRFLPVTEKWTPFYPAMECFTRDKLLILKAELPGVDPKDIEVSIVGNQVFLRGEKKVERDIDDKNYFVQEVAHGRFERIIALPEGVKADQVKATFNNGVLELIMPSGVADQARKVPIELIEGKKVKAA